MICFHPHLQNNKMVDLGLPENSFRTNPKLLPHPQFFSHCFRPGTLYAVQPNLVRAEHMQHKWYRRTGRESPVWMYLSARFDVFGQAGRASGLYIDVDKTTCFSTSVQECMGFPCGKCTLQVGCSCLFLSGVSTPFNINLSTIAGTHDQGPSRRCPRLSQDRRSSKVSCLWTITRFLAACGTH